MRKHTALQKIAALLSALCLLMGAFPAMAADVGGVAVQSAALTTQSAPLNGMVRVWLSSLGSPSRLDLTVAGSYSLGGDLSRSFSSGTSLTVSFNSASGQLTLSQNGVVIYMGGDFSLRRHSTSGVNGIMIAQARESGNPYPGDLSFQAVKQSGGSYKLYVIAHVYIEDYLYGVVPYEMGNSSNVEALKAQAVAARTYTVRMMSRRASGRYDVVDTTSDQVYRGTPSGNANCVTAIDSTRYPISATEIRKNILGNWHYILGAARPFFAKKVLIAGTESCGKTTLTKCLAKLYNTSWSEEVGRYYARDYLGNDETIYTDEDFGRIAHIQYEQDYHALRSANKVCFFDTDATYTDYFSELYMGHRNELVEKYIDHTRYDRLFYLMPDVRWVADGQRLNGDEDRRRILNDRLLQMYRDYGFGDKITIISGDYNARLHKAIQLVDDLLTGVRP